MTRRNATLAEIASKHLHLETLETRNGDSLDFHDMAVWSLKAALAAAYKAGRQSCEPRPSRRSGKVGNVVAQPIKSQAQSTT